MKLMLFPDASSMSPSQKGHFLVTVASVSETVKRSEGGFSIMTIYIVGRL